ncbi:hypothetical protein N7467_001636 [Penicillium canescens]|nr:hypothetical protein N7467_001636 [Penicillium canescens]
MVTAPAAMEKSIRMSWLVLHTRKLSLGSTMTATEGKTIVLCCDQKTAEALIFAVTDKAEGVFLWVRLVVGDLLKGIRDGDGIRTLYRKVEEIPADLNDYFKRLFSSINPQHMREASIILQVALHEEHDFVSLHPLRLLDLSFTDESSPDFALADSWWCRWWV